MRIWVITLDLIDIVIAGRVTMVDDDLLIDPFDTLANDGQVRLTMHVITIRVVIWMWNAIA